jgi:glycosyltransferase involved in cell wall biosynthesis
LLSKHWLPSAARRAASFLVAAIENITGSLCDAVVPAVPSIAKLFPAGKTTTIHNFPDSRFVQNPGGSEVMASERERGRIVYVGGISFVRGIGTMIDAMAGIPEALGPQLVLAGEFPSALRDEFNTKPGWTRVLALGRQSRSGVLELLRSSQVGLCVLHSTPNHIDSYPTKLFEYMACGLPIVASDFPLWREFVHGCNCGLLVDPMNPASIAEAITWIMEHPKESEQMGRNGQHAVSEKYNWEAESRNLVEMYRKLITAE